MPTPVAGAFEGRHKRKEERHKGTKAQRHKGTKIIPRIPRINTDEKNCNAVPLQSPVSHRAVRSIAKHGSAHWVGMGKNMNPNGVPQKAPLAPVVNYQCTEFSERLGRHIRENLYNLWLFVENILCLLSFLWFPLSGLCELCESRFLFLISAFSFPQFLIPFPNWRHRRLFLFPLGATGAFTGS